MPVRLSRDEKLIERLRRTQRRRRPLGILFVAIAVLGAAAGYFFIKDLHHRTMETLLHRTLETLKASSTTQQIEQQLEQQSLSLTHYHIGFISGEVLVATLFLSMNLAGAGLNLLFGGRKDRLLLQCWDNQHPPSSNQSGQD